MAAHLLFLLALLLPSLAGEQVAIKLKTGKTVTGEILKDGKEEIILATDLGTLLIKVDKIQSRKVLSGSGKTDGAKDGEAQKKVDPFDPEKVLAEVESRVKKASGKKGSSSKTGGKSPTAKSDGSGEGSTPTASSKSGGPIVGDRFSPPKGALYGGRLLDRFDWAAKMETGTKISIFAALYLLFWASISVLTRLLDVENTTSGKSALAALIWVSIIVGMLLIPNPTQVIVGILGFCLFVAWLMTTRGILGASWPQSIYLFLLGSLGVLILYMLVEVGSNILELKV